jgi:hypothetical protein
MKIIATKQNGCIYLCEFRNDYDAIADILHRSPLNPVIDALSDKFINDTSDELWNAKMQLVLQALETAGCEILWE